MPPLPVSETPPVILAPGNTFASSSGSFSPDTSAVFFYSFTDVSGYPYDPSDINVTIYDSNATAVATITSAQKLELGVFAIEWAIPSTTTTGRYTISIDYTVETLDGPIVKNLSEIFTVAESGNDIITFRQTALRSFLETLLREMQRIPVYNEVVRLNRIRNLGEVTFRRWNQSAGANIYINGKRAETGFDIDYWKGRVLFQSPLSEYDEVTADYNFRWFESSELDNFLEQGVNIVNIWPPWSSWTVNSIPDMWIIASEYAAAVDAIRSFMLSINFQQPALIFGGLDRAKDVFSNLNTIKQNYESFLEKMLEQKKRGPYTGLTKSIVVPEYTLPGGRCLSSDTQISTMIDDVEETLSLADIFAYFSDGKEIKILSHDEFNRTVCFKNVFKIWDSGVKNVYTITTKTNQKVTASLEHLFYLDGLYVPLERLRIGNRLLCIDQNRHLFEDKIISIEPNGEKQTFDIEVPETENLFANNIKCHNSRWFRYLFKGGS